MRYSCLHVCGNPNSNWEWVNGQLPYLGYEYHRCYIWSVWRGPRGLGVLVGRAGPWLPSLHIYNKSCCELVTGQRSQPNLHNDLLQLDLVRPTSKTQVRGIELKTTEFIPKKIIFFICFTLLVLRNLSHHKTIQLDSSSPHPKPPFSPSSPGGCWSKWKLFWTPIKNKSWGERKDLMDGKIDKTWRSISSRKGIMLSLSL